MRLTALIRLLWPLSFFCLNDTLVADRSDLESRDSRIEQVRTIDEKIRVGWSDYQLFPSAPASDLEYCRRLFLDVLGRIPSVDELREYARNKSPRKREELVAMLLHDSRYAEEYAKNWSTKWSNILIGRSTDEDGRSLTNRKGMEVYLRQAFSENRPFDRMVYELITATGGSSPGSKNFNGAVNFLADKLADGAAQATAQTARIFLGLQVQCTQCHNHPFNDWKQNQYWELNSFFRQTVSLRRFEPGGDDVSFIELTDQDFAGDDNDPSGGRIYYELRNGYTKVATPTFVDGTKISESGYVSDVHRRNELGKLVVESDYMAQAIVNRVWAHFLGHGFTKPIDDLGPHNPVSHPALLQYLSEQFRSHSFDLKQLMQWIVLSEAYSLSSEVTAKNQDDDPALGVAPQFSHFYVRQMRAEELYESLLVATEAHKTKVDAEQQDEAKQKWLEQFTIAFGTDEGDEITTFNGTIPQALMMFNGELIRQATSAEPGSFLYRIAHDEKMNNATKINRLFLSALARKPTKQEVRIANQLLYARQGDAVEALQDIWWALLNSNEFILNH